ncbi:sensor histidine kinase [Novosphingobium album (ex Liu et al. 2023)]|nr:sensor histidine kinase [Novosphingobium album (ex Liu et al. 2023)]
MAQAMSDAEDRLLCADEPIAGLQRRCGGDLPGTIAVPELLELVRKARRYGFKLARAIAAHDGDEAITAWIEVQPRPDGEPGCEIVLRNWRAAPLPAEDEAEAQARRTAIDHHVAELSARLDAGQRLLAVTCESAELASLATAMEAGLGHVWTDFLPLADTTHHQPLHWRLLDGARVAIEGSARDWRVALIPQGHPGFDPAGFELLLLSDAPASAIAAQPAPARDPDLDQRLVGQDLAPILRQPIARIIANAETIRTRLAGPLNDAYAEYAGEIANAGKLLLDLLDDLSDLEVVESAHFHTAPDRIDLADVARQAAGILGVRAREKAIRIEAPQPDETLPAIAEFRRVLQILLNLVGNAIRYAPEGSRIWVRLEGAGDRARVIVADQGPGLSEAEQAMVFEKFERLGRSGDGGSGLGLYISRSLARAMGGDLTVESAKGHGARFILDVPADRAD